MERAFELIRPFLFWLVFVPQIVAVVFLRRKSARESGALALRVHFPRAGRWQTGIATALFGLMCLLFGAELGGRYGEGVWWTVFAYVPILLFPFLLAIPGILNDQSRVDLHRNGFVYSSFRFVPWEKLRDWHWSPYDERRLVMRFPNWCFNWRITADQRAAVEAALDEIVPGKRTGDGGRERRSSEATVR